MDLQCFQKRINPGIRFFVPSQEVVLIMFLYSTRNLHEGWQNATVSSFFSLASFHHSASTKRNLNMFYATC